MRSSALLLPQSLFAKLLAADFALGNSSSSRLAYAAPRLIWTWRQSEPADKSWSNYRGYLHPTKGYRGSHKFLTTPRGSGRR